MAKVDTAVLVEHDGAAWLGEWTQYPPYTGRDGKVAPNCYLVVYQVIYGVKVPLSDLGLSHRQGYIVSSLIANKRTAELRSQLFPTGNESVDEVLDVILEKVRNREWMGQTTHNQEFTTYELALLLDVTEREAGELAKSLEENRKATLLAGDIIMPCEKD